ncbi:3304_t:CDS:2, partial [Dentiscutata erythropus]
RNVKMSTFNFTTSTLTLKAIQGWTVETVEAFLKFKQTDFSLSDAEIQKLVDCSVNGPALLNGNIDNLISIVGLRYGPAVNVTAFVENLNNQTLMPHRGKKRRRMLEDNTLEYCRQIATPFESPPNISELNSMLLQPFNLKIPLSPLLYKYCERLCKFPITEYFVESPWDTQLDEEDVCHPAELSNYCYVALQGVDVGSREFCDWDSLIRNPTSVLRQNFKTKSLWKANRKTNDSSITLAGRMPDYWENLNDVLVFKGEEKPTEDGLKDAKNELISKMRAWNRCLFGDLKYILAYAAGGAHLQFYAIDPSFNLHLISDTLNALICIFNIHRIIRSMESLLPETVVPAWRLFKRKYGDIFITDTEIEKRIFPFSTYPFNYITVLTDIYRNTKNNRNTIRAVEGPQIVNDSYKVKLTPVGVRRMPRTEQEVKAAISCYVHRDVRWDNILQVIDNSWMLIDLECAGIDNERVYFDPSEVWAPEVIETKIYTKKADVYMVGRLFRYVYISLSEKAYEFEKATTAELEIRLTAQEARQHPWLLNI